MAVSSGFCEDGLSWIFVEAVIGLDQQQEHRRGVSGCIVRRRASPLGLTQMVVICVSGILFGLLALWRNSLRPGMLAHAWADIFGGILVKGLPYK